MRIKKKKPLIVIISLICIIPITLYIYSLIEYSEGKKIAANIYFDADFESGSIEDTELISAKRVRTDKGKIWKLHYEITSGFDPVNPVDSTLKPSGRWFYFRMTGVKDKQIHLEFKNTDPVAPVYSYDDLNYERFNKDSFIKQFDKDTVYIAYYIPYTFQYLQNRFEKWLSTNNIAKFDTVGWSVEGRPLQRMIITDKTVSDINKKKIYIHGRIHPSETPASWHLDGMIDQLLSDTPQAKAFRQNAIFYIIPFVNPDGVVNGLSRSNMQGINMEINYNQPDSITATEVKALKDNYYLMTTERPLDIFLNMHSQSIPRITYWIHTAESTSPKFYQEQLLLANLTISHSSVFEKDDLQFSDVAPRYLEGQIWEQFQDRTMAITFETPYTYYNDNPEGTWLTLENLRDLSTSTLQALADYFQINTSECFYVQPQPVNKNDWNFLTDYNFVYFGKGFYEAKRKDASVKYELKNLPAGKYSIYKWMVGKAEEISEDKESEWIKIHEMEQENSSLFIYLHKSENVGDKANVIVLRRE